MIEKRWEGSAVVVAATVFVLLVARAASSASVAAGAKNPKAAQSEGHPNRQSLRSLTLISTKAAAEAATRAKIAKSNARPQTSKVPAVGEFHPVSEATAGDTALRVTQKNRGLLREVHGSVYGARSAVRSDEGGDVGASSRSGKLSIFVASQGTAAKSPASH